MNRIWTQEEVDFLYDNLGVLSYKSIGKKLNRTSEAVRSKCQKLKLGGITLYSEFLTTAELGRAIGRDKSTIVRYIKNNGLPARKKILAMKRVYYQISLKNFWKWAEKNKELIKWDNFEEGSLGLEPKWVKEVRKNSYCKPRNRGTYWSKREDSLLVFYLDSGKDLKELAKILKRSSGAINARAKRLNLRRNIMIKWKDIEVEILLKMVNEGFTNVQIAEELGRSVTSVKGKREKLVSVGLLPSMRNRHIRTKI